MLQQPLRILVADADQTSRKYLTWHLQDAGYFVIPAATGADVLLQCEIDPPDAAVLDVRLPDIDGYDVCSQLRRDHRTQDIPIILTTVVADNMSRTYLSQMVEFAGGDYFVAKPCDVNVLVQLVRDVVPQAPRPRNGSSGDFPTRVVWPTTRMRSVATMC